MSKLFLIAGLGADCRIYQKLNLDGHDVVNVNWLPFDATDTLTSYAQKLISHYNIIENSTVIGNSMGGMLAMEISKKITLKKTILISSIRTINEAPVYFRFFRSLPVYRLIPGGAINYLDYFMDRFFGKLKQTDHGFFIDMLTEWSPEFLKWAIDAILKWDNTTIPEHTVLVTGDKDRMFPFKNTRDAIVVQGGTHTMVYERAESVSEILKEFLPK